MLKMHFPLKNTSECSEQLWFVLNFSCEQYSAKFRQTAQLKLRASHSQPAGVSQNVIFFSFLKFYHYPRSCDGMHLERANGVT